MKLSAIFRMLRGEAAVTSTEYAIMLTLILGACTTAINCLGQATHSTYQNMSNSMQDAGS